MSGQDSAFAREGKLHHDANGCPLMPYQGHGWLAEPQAGMTKRELFAALAMQGILGHKMPYDHAPDAFERPAYEAVRAADALLAALGADHASDLPPLPEAVKLPPPDHYMPENGERAYRDQMVAYGVACATAAFGHACRVVDEERMFPMQKGPPIPWRIAEVIYAGYAALNGTQQTLERLAERGGFGWSEVEHMWDKHQARKAMQAALESTP